ncbi:MAG: DNA-directed RNA polymerase subunit omega [Gemmataceae bacterium]|jgi:DNA-directed RNA polymerase subunit omega|nr:DNA-directed RNA polymerase subunit omega [Gemmataceae bacterium]
MQEELKEESIINKIGGRFKLSTLIQKRLVALTQGAKPLVDMKTSDKMAIVLQEIIQDKVYLDLENNLKTRPAEGEVAEDAVPYGGTGSVDG